MASWVASAFSNGSFWYNKINFSWIFNGYAKWTYCTKIFIKSKFLLERIVGPFIASFCTLAITHPIDTARVRISMNYYQNSRELFTGITSCWSYIRL